MMRAAPVRSVVFALEVCKAIFRTYSLTRPFGFSRIQRFTHGRRSHI